MARRMITAIVLLPALIALYVVGVAAGLLWIGLVAGWNSATEVIDWIVGDTYTWKVTITKVAKEPTHD